MTEYDELAGGMSQQQQDQLDAMRTADERLSRLRPEARGKAAEIALERRYLHNVERRFASPPAHVEESAATTRARTEELARLVDRFAEISQETAHDGEISLLDIIRALFLAAAYVAADEETRTAAAALAESELVAAAAMVTGDSEMAAGTAADLTSDRPPVFRPLRDYLEHWGRALLATEGTEERRNASTFLVRWVRHTILVDAFWILTQELEASLVEAEKTGKRDTAPLTLRDDPYVPASTEHVYYEVARGLSQPDLWHRDEATGWPTMVVSGKEVAGHIQMVPPAIDGQSFRTPEERSALEASMWGHHGRLSARTRLVLRAVEIFWRQRSRMNPETPVLIGVDEILDFMNKKPKTGADGRRSGHRAKERRLILDELAKIQAVQIRATVTLTERGRNGKARRVEKQVFSRLFTMQALAGQMELDGGMDVQVVKVTPDGPYAHHLLTSKHVPYDRRLLAENPKTHGMVIGLVEALYQDLRRNGGAYRPRRYLGLLEEAGVKQLRYPSEELERAETTMAYLVDNGYFASVEWRDFDPADAYGRGATKKLKDASWLVEPPEYTRQKLDAIGRKRRRSQPATPAAAPIAARLTRARTALGRSQAQAAEDAGVPQQTFSRAERGLNVAAGTRQKLERWLARVEPADA